MDINAVGLESLARIEVVGVVVIIIDVLKPKKYINGIQTFISMHGVAQSRSIRKYCYV